MATLLDDFADAPAPAELDDFQLDDEEAAPLPPPPTAEDLLEIEYDAKAQAIARFNAADAASRAAVAAFKAAVKAAGGKYTGAAVGAARKAKNEAAEALAAAALERDAAFASYAKAAKEAEALKAEKVLAALPGLEEARRLAAVEDALVPCGATELGNRARAAYWSALAAAGGGDLEAAKELGEIALISELNRSMLFVHAQGIIMRQAPSDEDGDDGVETVAQTPELARISLGTLGSVPADVVARWPISAEALKSMARRTYIYTMWATSDKRRQAERVGFYPVGPGDAPQRCPRSVYNTYSGPGIGPGAGDPAGPAAIEFEHHVRSRICGGNEALFEAVMSWCAHLVQRPGDTRARWALVLRGKKGTGKTMLYSVLRQVLGSRYCRLAMNKEQVVGRFGSCIENALLVALDELVWAGSHEEDGAMKKLITEDRPSIERKGVDAYTIRNCARFMVMTNSRWAVPATGDERRYTVCDLSDELSNDKALGERVFRTLSEGIQDVAALLYSWNIDDSHLNACVRTEALEEQAEEGLTGVARWLAEEVSTAEANLWGQRCKNVDLLGRYTSKLPRKGERQLNAVAFGRELNRLLRGVKGFRPVSFGKGGRDGSGYQLPEREDALEGLRAALNMPGLLRREEAGPLTVVHEPGQSPREKHFRAQFGDDPVALVYEEAREDNVENKAAEWLDELVEEVSKFVPLKPGEDVEVDSLAHLRLD